MTLEELLAKLRTPGVAVDRLLDEARAPDRALWKAHPELYPLFVEKLLAGAHSALALELAREGKEHLPDSSRLQWLLARAAVNGGSTRYAEILLAPLLARATGPDAQRPADMDDKLRMDVIALQGRIFKDRSEREPELVAKSIGWYQRAADACGTADPTFPLINVATMWRVAGEKERAAAIAADVVARLGDTAEPAAAAGDPWPAATLGEAHVLLGRHEDAVRWYLLAVDVANREGNTAWLLSLLNNLRRLHAVGATADPAFLRAHLGSVVAFSGHLLDSPDRLATGAPPRFPRHPQLVAAVGEAIRQRLDALNAKVGYCSLGCGGDILFAEAMLARGAELHVVLPFARDDFLRTSVNFGHDGQDWRDWQHRFDAVLKRVPEDRVRQLTREPYLGSRDLFATANAVLQGLAVLHARARASEPTALVLLDPSAADRPGGTADFLAGWTAAGHPAERIDLAALRAEHPTPALSPEPPARLPRPVKAMLFADLAGYSKISEWDLLEFLPVYGAYLRALFGSPVGRAAVYANTWGDAIYAVFDTAADAAAFATELVEPELGPVPDWSAFGLGPTNPMRVGLHTGPVFELTDLFQTRSGFAGQHVNRAARIEPVTVRGCAYASEPFAALLAMQAGARFSVEPVGVHSLAKDYDRCPLYRVQRRAPGGR